MWGLLEGSEEQCSHNCHCTDTNCTDHTCCHLHHHHEVGDIVPDTFDVLLTAVLFRAKVYINDEMQAVIMKGKQFPLISNIVPTTACCHYEG
jgi:hypothetical protein